MLTSTYISCILAVCAGLASAPVAAQDTHQLPLFEGKLVLRADGGIRSDVREPDGALIEFWRPVQFEEDGNPLAGRMDCKLGGVRQDYTDELFDIRQRYRESRDARERSGLDDDDRDYDEAGDIRRLEVTGRASDPHRHYVLTYLVMRDEPYLYDIRLNCEFRHRQSPDSDTDYAAIMRQYVDIGVPVPAPSSNQSADG